MRREKIMIIKENKQKQQAEIYLIALFCEVQHQIMKVNSEWRKYYIKLKRKNETNNEKAKAKAF